MTRELKHVAITIVKSNYMLYLLCWQKDNELNASNLVCWFTHLGFAHSLENCNSAHTSGCRMCILDLWSSLRTCAEYHTRVRICPLVSLISRLGITHYGRYINCTSHDFWNLLLSLRLYKTLIKPLLCYGSVTWILTQAA
jgi:hypothetical protein